MKMPLLAIAVAGLGLRTMLDSRHHDLLKSLQMGLDADLHFGSVVIRHPSSGWRALLAFE